MLLCAGHGLAEGKCNLKGTKTYITTITGIYVSGYRFRRGHFFQDFIDFIPLLRRKEE